MTSMHCGNKKAPCVAIKTAIALAVSVATTAMAITYLYYDKMLWMENNIDVAAAPVAAARSSAGTHRAARRLAELDAVSRKQPASVLVMGLPRSGADSIHAFFQCMGLSSSHYCCATATDSSTKKATAADSVYYAGKPVTSKFACPKQSSVECGACVHSNMLENNGNKPAFSGCGDYQVYAGFDVETADPFSWFLPQHFALPLLHEHYEDATWILNTRGTAEQWAVNVLHWYSVTNRLFNSFGIPYHKDLEHVPVTTALTSTTALTKRRRRRNSDSSMSSGKHLYAELERSLERAKNQTEHARRKAALIDIYERHSAKIRAFCTSSSSSSSSTGTGISHSHQLIEISVDDANAGIQLAASLGLDQENAATCWAFDAEKLDSDWKDFRLNL